MGIDCLMSIELIFEMIKFISIFLNWGSVR